LASFSFKMKKTAFGNTDLGCVRKRNEDAFLVDEKSEIYAVADGLGGLPGGDRASQLAVELLREAFPGPLNGVLPDFPALFESINERIFREGCLMKAEIGIGTTLTALFLPSDGSYIISHVGDSIAYLWRDSKLFQLTEEHTMEMELRNRSSYRGEYIPEYLSHTLTRCMGQMDAVEADQVKGEVLPGDVFLLCSDGIGKVLEPSFLEKYLREARTPQELVGNLIDEANRQGGPDNATAVAVFIERN
jgi:PPM family protein phosphatase